MEALRKTSEPSQPVRGRKFSAADEDNDDDDDDHAFTNNRGTERDKTSKFQADKGICLIEIFLFQKLFSFEFA